MARAVCQYNQYKSHKMGPHIEQSFLKRRTSERRRLKLLRNIDEYKIANPFKSSRTDISIPETLYRQLKKLDFLSLTSVSLLRLESNEEMYSSEALERMSSAMLNQQAKCEAYFGPFKIFEDKENTCPKKIHFVDSANTKEELQVYEQNDLRHELLNVHTFAVRGICEEDYNLFGNEEDNSQLEIPENTKTLQLRATDEVLVDEDFQNYFAN